MYDTVNHYRRIKEKTGVDKLNRIFLSEAELQSIDR